MNMRVYPGSGKRRPYVQRGGDSLYYLAAKCLYRGEYKNVLEERSDVCELCSLSCLASASPFIDQGEAQGYRM
jgi:hypothetical protein